MNIYGLQVEQADEGVIWYAWIDNKFVIDGYGYNDAKSAFEAIGQYTLDKSGIRLTYTGNTETIEPKKEKSKWKFW